MRLPLDVSSLKVYKNSQKRNKDFRFLLFPKKKKTTRMTLPVGPCAQAAHPEGFLHWLDSPPSPRVLHLLAGRQRQVASFLMVPCVLHPARSPQARKAGVWVQGCWDRRTPPAHLLPEQAHLRCMMLFINKKAACFSKKCLGKHSLTQALPAGGRKLLKEPPSGYVCFHGWKLKRTLFFLIHWQNWYLNGFWTYKN